MSRRRHVCCLLAALLAMLLGPAATTALAGPQPGPALAVPASASVPTVGPGVPATPAAATAGARYSVRTAADGSAVRGDFSSPAEAEGRGPVCDPGGAGHGPAPLLPPRAGQDHAQLPAARAGAGVERPQGARPVRVLVRGPDRPAPGPVELSVMRV
ncbi:hypothetical protein OOK31_21585 [Streptomyces sp. NBC_00249]|uniref:hypothetical protein n=1 Tax=Streptomyces sp. NBC_00249 TaxID=2975690 RepID=UPI00225C0B64|nr:hypothetical protein [Streptomyces sp. NBC_00249]MCX5196452.1 hypothetical protein [Streptomyces sp. NBC_00249]